MRELSLNNCRIDRRYEVREVLGSGSYAEIFVATDSVASPQSTHKQVVIKALNVFLQNDLDADLERTLVENFQNEAIALDRVRHPNIISRLGHGTARDLVGTVFHYLVLEYLSGGDLQNAVKKRRLELGKVMNYVEQICAGLGHAHKNGVIHRDIKPQNLLLTADLATVKIADFGVARFSLADSPITRVGTNIYAPPEHSPLSSGNYEPSSLTPAADVYSLAKTIYTIVTRESPRQFSGREINDLPAEFRYEVWADDLIRVLRRATNDDPLKRQQSTDDLWNDLAIVARYVDNEEPETVFRRNESEPQPHVSRGYTPLVPAQPSFESNIPLVNSAPYVAPVTAAKPIFSPLAPKTSSTIGNRTSIPIEQPPKKRRLARRLGIFAIVIATFAGILYGTATYFRGSAAIPQISNPFKTQTAKANTDIFLRSGASADTDKIGLVTKDSRVKIVKSQNSWYQVDVIEQGRDKADTGSATRGWLNGKFLELDNN